MMLRTLLVFVCWSVGSALTGHVVSCRHRSTLTLPHNKRYDWDLPKGSDGDLVTDLLVEMGASTAVIVPLEQETSFLETNGEFMKTGRIKTTGAWTKVSFSVDHNTIDADSLVASVADLCGIQVEEGSIHEWEEEKFLEQLNLAVSVESIKAPVFKLDGKKVQLVATTDQWAFGDGAHPSTRVCLEALERESLKGSSVLDFGCGTGILTLAALCLGAVQACAVDVSEDALDITQKNLQHNKHLFDQHHKVQVVYGADYDSRHESFDVVIANIPSTTLMTVLPTLVSSMKRKILLAGYPSSEARLVSQEADKLGLIERPERRVYDCGWILQEFEASTSC